MTGWRYVHPAILSTTTNTSVSSVSQADFANLSIWFLVLRLIIQEIHRGKHPDDGARSFALQGQSQLRVDGLEVPHY